MGLRYLRPRVLKFDVGKKLLESRWTDETHENERNEWKKWEMQCHEFEWTMKRNEQLNEQTTRLNDWMNDWMDGWINEWTRTLTDYRLHDDSIIEFNFME